MNRFKKAVAALGLAGLMYAGNGYAEEAKAKKSEAKQEVSLAERCRDYKPRELSGEAKRHYNAGVRAQMSKRYEEAIAEYSKAAELDPSARGPPYQIGWCYREQGNFEEAIKWYLKTIEIQPCDIYAYGALGLLYFQLRDYEKSIYYNSLHLQINPHDKDDVFISNKIAEAKKIIDSSK